MPPKPILGYWNIRGWAEPIRYLLYNLGIDFEDRMFVQDSNDEFNGSDWQKVKFKLGLDFPNLPFFIDGEDRTTYSLAIIQYICQKYRPEYLGRSPQLQLKALNISYNLFNVGFLMFQSFLFPGGEERIPLVVPVIREKLEWIAKLISKTRYIADDEVTWADFLLFEFCLFLEIAIPGLTQSVSPLFQEFVDNFRQLPGILECENRANRPNKLLAAYSHYKI